MELVSCHISGAKNFEEVRKLLEDLFIPAFNGSYVSWRVGVEGSG